MIVAGPHAQMVAQMAGELVPLAESVFPMLRRPLAEELTTHLAHVTKHIRSDLVPVMYIYGRPLAPEHAQGLAPLEEAAQKERVADLEKLIAALRSGKQLSIADFVGTLIAHMAEAIDLFGKMQAKQARGWDASGAGEDVEAAARAIDVHVEDLQTIVRGDTAFRTLLYFLELSSKVMNRTKPRSMVSLRSASL